MLYMTYLSFHEHGEDEGRGNFSCVIEAENIQEAVEMTANLIERIHEKTEAFSGTREIYLDDIIQVKSIPPQGFMAHWMWAPDDAEGTVSTVLPEVPEEFCEAFCPEPEGDGGDEDEVTVEPFITFE